MTITTSELKLLLLVASPLTAWRCDGDPTAELLVRDGLMAEGNPGIGRITPTGLRALADAIEQDLHLGVIESMISEVNNRECIIAGLENPNPVAP